MKKIEQIDISGDVGLKVCGKSLEEIFQGAAEGMMNLITNASAIKETERKDIALEAGSAEERLVQWLNELVFLFDTYGFVGRIFTMNIAGDEIKASISGGTFDPDINESKLLIKAATYHNLSIKKINSLWEATVIFDI